MKNVKIRVFAYIDSKLYNELLSLLELEKKITEDKTLSRLIEDVLKIGVPIRRKRTQRLLEAMIQKQGKQTRRGES